MSDSLNEIPEVGQRLKIGRTKVFELIRGNDLAAVRIGRRTLVPDSSIDAYIERLKAAAGSGDAA